MQDVTYGIQFDRLPLAGGLKFELVGWTGPLIPGKREYNVDNRFDIILPSHAVPEGNVIIVDANHPKGIVIKIRFGGVGPPQSSSAPVLDKVSDLKEAEVDPSEPKTLQGGHDKINVLFREAFQIKAGADVPKEGSVSIKFDPTFLDIQNAGISDSNLVWTFNSLQTGNTQVIVSTRGGIAQFAITKTYDVRVFVLDEEDEDSSATDNDKGAILSYLGRVNIAVRIVTAAYPDAVLVLVDANSVPKGTYVNSSNRLPQLVATFNSGKGHVTIRSTGWGPWGKPTYRQGNFLGVEVINIHDIHLEATDADKLLEQAGWGSEFDRLTLSHPLTGPDSPLPGKPQAYYTYQLKDGHEVRVGTVDHKVYPPNEKQN